MPTNIHTNKKAVNSLSMDEKSKILEEVREFAQKVKQCKKLEGKVTLTSGPVSSLGKVLNTQEKQIAL